MVIQLFILQFKLHVIKDKKLHKQIIIRLEASLQPNTGFTLRP